MSHFLADQEISRGLDFSGFVNFLLVDKVDTGMVGELLSLGKYLASLKKGDKKKLKLHLLNQQKWFSVDFTPQIHEVSEYTLLKKLDLQ